MNESYEKTWLTLRAAMGWIILDLLDDKISERTIECSGALMEYPFWSRFDFVRIIAGAAPDCDYHELREVAKDELILYLKGESNGNK